MSNRRSPRDRIPLGPGQESVWDYPRPPRVEACARQLRVVFAGVTIANSRRTQRVLETSHPPVYYFPPEDVRIELLEPSPSTTWCEWKGKATYYSLRVGDKVVTEAAWCYLDPSPGMEPICRHLAFYPGKMEACFVDEERVECQEGDFYGGWITSEIVGPFKGGAGTSGW